MKNACVFVLVLWSAIAARASYLPYFDDLRAAITARQEAISNAPPITKEGNKELGALRKALTTIDKPSVTLAGDLSTFSKVVTAINKGASNETFEVKLETTASNYIAVLTQTNNALESALTNANNNPALKEKAQDAVNAAKTQLQALNPQTDIGGTAKGLISTLKAYVKAAKAVTTAVNADPAPTPNPSKGEMVLQVNGQVFTYDAIFTPRVNNFVVLLDTDGFLRLEIPMGAGAGTYTYSAVMGTSFSGVAHSFVAQGNDAQVTTANANTVAGTITGTGTLTPSGGIPMENVPFTIKFNGNNPIKLP